jgi:hypothetical protein
MEITDMKIEFKSWAIKLRGRSFYKMSAGGPATFNTRQDATIFAGSLERNTGIKAEPVRVRVRIEEIA